MRGPQHYQRAEMLIDEAFKKQREGLNAQSQLCIQAAQVHATLAQTAAQGIQFIRPFGYAEWDEAINDNP